MALRNNEHFREFILGVSDYGEDTVKLVIYGTTDDREKHAGMALAITEILKATNTPPEKLGQIARKAK